MCVKLKMHSISSYESNYVFETTNFKYASRLRFSFVIDWIKLDTFPDTSSPEFIAMKFINGGGLEDPVF